MPILRIKIQKTKPHRSGRFPTTLKGIKEYLKTWVERHKKTLKIAIPVLMIVIIAAVVIFLRLRANIPAPVINKTIVAGTQGFIFANHNENFDVKFGVNNSGQPEHLMLFEKDGAKISFQYLNTDTNMKVSKSDMKSDKGEAISIVKFSDIYKSTLVYYQITSNSIKEDILLTGKDAPPTFVMALTTDNVEYKTDANQNINFSKDGSTVFALAPLFMQDVQGQISHEITTKIDFVKKSDQGENIYRFTIEPSQTWLTDTSRKYPVTIDPTIIFP